MRLIALLAFSLAGPAPAFPVGLFPAIASSQDEAHVHTGASSSDLAQGDANVLDRLDVPVAGDRLVARMVPGIRNPQRHTRAIVCGSVTTPLAVSGTDSGALSTLCVTAPDFTGAASVLGDLSIGDLRTPFDALPSSGSGNMFAGDARCPLDAGGSGEAKCG